jgi:hypothetical protein
VADKSSGLRRVGFALVRFSQRPALRLFVGLSLLLSGFDDLVEDLSGGEGMFNIDLFHGVTVFALQQVIHAVGMMLEGVQETGKHALRHGLSPGHQVFDPGNPGEVVVDHGHHQRHQQHESHE